MANYRHNTKNIIIATIITIISDNNIVAAFLFRYLSFTNTHS